MTVSVRPRLPALFGRTGRPVAVRGLGPGPALTRARPETRLRPRRAGRAPPRTLGSAPPRRSAARRRGRSSWAGRRGPAGGARERRALTRGVPGWPRRAGRGRRGRGRPSPTARPRSQARDSAALARARSACSGGSACIRLPANSPPLPCALRGHTQARASTGLPETLRTAPSVAQAPLPGQEGTFPGPAGGEALGQPAPRSYPASLHLRSGHDNDTRALVHRGTKGSHVACTQPCVAIYTLPTLAWLLLWVTLKGNGPNCQSFWHGETEVYAGVQEPAVLLLQHLGVTEASAHGSGSFPAPWTPTHSLAPHPLGPLPQPQQTEQALRLLL
nr:uncharacterized protein LOC105877674 [Microcebus murinus]